MIRKSSVKMSKPRTTNQSSSLLLPAREWRTNLVLAAVTFGGLTFELAAAATAEAALSSTVATALLLARPAHGHASYLACTRSITTGNTIMGSAAVQSGSTSIKLQKGGSPINCGGALTAGDTGLTFALSGQRGQYIIEATASAGKGLWGIQDGECCMVQSSVKYCQRLLNTASNTYTVPASGTVIVRVAWASAYGEVKLSPDCTYTVAAASAPPPPVPAPSSSAAIVRLASSSPPKLLLAGVAVPVPFSLIAVGIECSDDEEADDCLLVEAVLYHTDCPLLKSESALSSPKTCGKGVQDLAGTPLTGYDVSHRQDCGVIKQTLKSGTGASPPKGASVTAHYTGTLQSGIKFDSSRDRGVPYRFTLGQGDVIACWDQAFATMTTGEHAILTCTAPNAYGKDGAGTVIPGGATLIFDVELLSWEGGQATQQHATDKSNGNEIVAGDMRCGRVLGSKRIAVTALTEETGEVMVRVSETGVYNMELRSRRLGNNTVLASHQLRAVKVIPGYLCVAPAFVIVFMAVYTKNVVLALMSGLTVGGTLVSGYNPFVGFMRAGDTFLYDAVQHADQGLLLFTWFMSGLVGLISRNGGAAGLGNLLARYATSPIRAQLLTAAAGITIFFDDYSSILIVGPTMKPMCDACGISRPKLGA
jgi:FK506-binding protein 4/5